MQATQPLDPTVEAGAAPLSPRTACVLALAGAAVFLWLASPQLEAPGLEYDEVHQACGAFGWLGVQSSLFSLTHVGTAPLFTMHYSGALKTAIYGLWMRCSGAEFSVLNWRWLGLVFAALGVALLPWLLRRRLSVWPMLLLMLWVLTDVTLLLGARHDRGPVALAFLLRVLLIGVLFGRPMGAALSRRAWVLAGVLLGLATWEKLPNALMLAPVCWVLAQQARPWGAALCAVAGGLIGAAPIALANGMSLAHGQGLFSLHEVSGENPYTIALWLQQMGDMLTTGSGGLARANMLGMRDASNGVGGAAGPVIELALVALLFVMLIVLAWRSGSAALRAATGSALAIVVVLPLMPEIATEHHHLLLLPFLPLATALALSSPSHAKTHLLQIQDAALCAPHPKTPSPRLRAGPVRIQDSSSANPNTPSPRLRTALGVLCCACVLVRVPTLWETQQALRDTPVASGAGFNPEFTRFAELAAAEGPNTRVLAAGWGIATQVHCLAQGAPNKVAELYWQAPSADAILHAAGDAHRMILVSPLNLRGVNKLRRDAFFSIAASLAPPPPELVQNQAAAWRRVPPAPPWSNFTNLRVETFEKLIRH